MRTRQCHHISKADTRMKIFLFTDLEDSSAFNSKIIVKTIIIGYIFLSNEKEEEFTPWKLLPETSLFQEPSFCICDHLIDTRYLLIAQTLFWGSKKWNKEIRQWKWHTHYKIKTCSKSILKSNYLWSVKFTCIPFTQGCNKISEITCFLYSFFF